MVFRLSFDRLRLGESLLAELAVLLHADRLLEFLHDLDGVLALVLRVLENASPELCGDIAENGIILTGGSAQLYGIDSFISRKTGVKTTVAENPGECAAKGIGILLKDKKNFDRDGYTFRAEEKTEEDSGE